MLKQTYEKPVSIKFVVQPIDYVLMQSKENEQYSVDQIDPGFSDGEEGW